MQSTGQALAHMSQATHGEFLDIVIGGKRAASGMASFADLLSREDAEAIHHYLIARANADWSGASRSDGVSK